MGGGDHTQRLHVQLELLAFLEHVAEGEGGPGPHIRGAVEGG